MDSPAEMPLALLDLASVRALKANVVEAAGGEACLAPRACSLKVGVGGKL